MADSEPPPGKVGTPEAAKVLGLTQQSVRNLVKRYLESGGEAGLKGEKHIEPEDNSTRYWVDAQDLERERAERQARLKAASGNDMERESAGVSAHELRVRLSEREREVTELRERLVSAEQHSDRLLSLLEAALGNRP